MSQVNNQSYINLLYDPKDFENDIKNLLRKYDVDCCTFLSISQDTAIRLISISFDNCLDYRFPEFFDFNKHKRNGIYYSYIKEGIYINQDSNKIESYIKKHTKEIFIPIKVNNKLILCIALSSADGEIPEIDFREFNMIMYNYSYLLNSLKVDKIINKNVLKYIVLLDKLYDEKNQHMVYHSYNVALWATEIAVEIGYEESNLRNLYLAALMQDIGYIDVNPNIVNKIGEYTDEEYNQLQKHVEYGFNICKDVLLGYYENLSLWIYQHHEKWDGTGYPNQLVGEQITKEARILKVADALDGMLSWRSYKSAMSFNQVIKELKDCKDKDFDPEIVDVAITVIRKRLETKENIINEFIMPAHLNITQGTEIICLDGHISKANDDLIFFANNDKPNFVNADITSIILSVEKFNVLNEYKVSFKKIESSTYVIDEISEKYHEKSFSLLWNLEGELIDLSTKSVQNIIISRISANEITFSLFTENYKVNVNNTYLISITFEDGTKMGISGKPIRSIKIGNRIHHEFVFLNLNDSKQTKIYHQLFLKQLSLRKLLY